MYDSMPAQFLFKLTVHITHLLCQNFTHFSGTDSTQPLTETSTRNISLAVKAAGA